jgi:hypothetical protein
MGSGVDLRKLAPSDYELWHKLLAESPQGSVYAFPAYLEALSRATGGSFSLLGVFRGDELIGGLPVYEESLGGRRTVANRLLLYYSGIVLKPHSTRYPSKATSKYLDVLDALASRLVEARYARVILNHQGMIDARPFMIRGWTARPGYTYVVPITDIKMAWGRIDQNLRRLIDRCDANGVTLSDDDDFASFYPLHLQVHDRKGAPVYLPRDAFDVFFKELRSKGLCRLYLARLADGKAVAGQLVLLGPAGRSYTVCAGADAEHLNIGTTPWLRWHAFVALSKDGYITNDLTDAALNEVTRFKAQLGGDLITNMVIQQPDAPALRRQVQLQKARYQVRNIIAAGARKVLKRSPKKS